MNDNPMEKFSGKDVNADSRNDDISSVYGNLTPREEAAAQVRVLAMKAAAEYRRRGEPIPPHVSSAMRAGLKVPPPPPLPPTGVWMMPTRYRPLAAAVVSSLLLFIMLAGWSWQHRERVEHRELQQQLETLQQQNQRIEHKIEGLTPASIHVTLITRPWAKRERMQSAVVAIDHQRAVAPGSSSQPPTSQTGRELSSSIAPISEPTLGQDMSPSVSGSLTPRGAQLSQASPGYEEPQATRSSKYAHTIAEAPIDLIVTTAHTSNQDSSHRSSDTNPGFEQSPVQLWPGVNRTQGALMPSGFTGQNGGQLGFSNNSTATFIQSNPNYNISPSFSDPQPCRHCR